MKNIDEDVKIKQWYSLFELSPRTQVLYSHTMNKFCDCAGKTPTELIKEAIGEIRKGLLPSERKTAEYIAMYKKQLKGSNAAPKTQASELAAIKSFYKAFDIDVPAASCRVKRALPLEENMNFLKKDDVHNLITNSASLRNKAIILMMATSGMAQQEIINMKVKNITFQKIGNVQIGIIKIRRQKTSVDYTTFCSPEAVVALNNYWEERNRLQPGFSPPDKLQIKNDNDFAFVSYHFGEQMQKPTFNSIFRREGDKLGYNNGKGNLRKSRSHALRKFFSSTLADAGMPRPKVDYMLGHYRSGNDIAYFNVDLELLKQLYIDYLPFLTFERDIQIQSLRTEDEKRLGELESQHEELMDRYNKVEDVLKTLIKGLHIKGINDQSFEEYFGWEEGWRENKKKMNKD